jgi:hypothetical protein
MPIIYHEDHEKVQLLIRHIQKVVKYCEISYLPCPLGRGRRTSCYFCFKPIFGDTKQMGMILARTFEGFKLKLKAEDDPKIILDCMFFTSTCEKI